MNRPSDDEELEETVMVIAPPVSVCDDLELTGDDLEAMLSDARTEREAERAKTMPTTLIGFMRYSLEQARQRHAERMNE